MPTFAMAGAASGCPKFDGIKSIMHARHNILTSAEFAPTPPKSQLEQLWERLVRVVTQPGTPS